MTQKTSFFIAGRHAVIGALKNPKRRVIKIFLTEESKKNIHKQSPNINLLKDIKVFFKTKKELDKYCRSEDIQHQGYVAEIEHLESPELKEFIKDKNDITFACLDEVSDPRNIGSIIRSAASFNIDGLIVKERHYPSESKLMYKAASGCIEYLNIFKVSNINTAMNFLKRNNFWICGYDKSGTKDFTKHDWKGNNVLLFGSEGYGLKYQTLKNSDFLLKIDISKKVESLNISNSAAIVFHYINKLQNS